MYDTIRIILRGLGIRIRNSNFAPRSKTLKLIITFIINEIRQNQEILALRLTVVYVYTKFQVIIFTLLGEKCPGNF